MLRWLHSKAGKASLDWTERLRILAYSRIAYGSPTYGGIQPAHGTPPFPDTQGVDRCAETSDGSGNHHPVYNADGCLQESSLYGYARQEDMCVGTLVADRDQEAEGLIALLANVVIIRTHLG